MRTYKRGHPPFVMELANSKLLDAAYRWLCHQRRAWPANADVWHLRFTWETARPQLLAQLGAGTRERTGSAPPFPTQSGRPDRQVTP